MKSSKILFITSIFILLFASTTIIENSRKSSTEVTITADGTTAPEDLDGRPLPPIVNPKSIHIIKTI